MKTFQLLNQKGIVRYMGPVEGLPSTQLGIELELPKGKHNGSYNGAPYFDCPPNHGVFATLSQVKPLPEIVPVLNSTKQQEKQLNIPTPVPQLPISQPAPPPKQDESKDGDLSKPMSIPQLSSRRSLKPPTGLKRPADRSRTPTKLPLAKSSSRLQAPAPVSKSSSKLIADQKSTPTAAGSQSPATKISLNRADSSISSKLGSKQELRKIGTSSNVGRTTQRTTAKEAAVSIQLKSDKEVPKTVVPQAIPSPLARKKIAPLRATQLPVKKATKMSLSKNTSTTFQFSDEEKSTSPQKKMIKPKQTQMLRNISSVKKQAPVSKRRELGGKIGRVNLDQKKLKAEESLASKLEEVENQLKILKQEKIKEIAKAKSEVQSKEKMIEGMKETHKLELKRQQEELTQKFKEMLKRKDNEEAGKKRMEEIEELKQQLEIAKLKQEKAEDEVEKMGLEIEQLRNQLESQKEEKDQLRVKLEQSVGYTGEESGSMSEEDLKKENERLKTALRQISGQMEMEKAMTGQELIEVKDELKRVQGLKTSLAEKEQDINLLLEELEEKEKQLTDKEIEVKALQDNIDSNSDLELMVQQLTNNVLEKEEEVEQLKTELAGLKEDLEVEEEATNEAEKLADILQSQVVEKEEEIKRQEIERKKIHQRVKELEQLVARFREKVVDLSSEREQLHQKLADSTEGDLKLKLHEVMDQQSHMFQLLREANRKEVAFRYSQITANQTRIKNEWMLSLLPSKLLHYSKIEAFSRVQLVETVKAKTYLLLHELHHSCFMNVSKGEREVARIEGTDPHLFFRWSCDLFYNTATLLDVLLHIGFVMTDLQLGHYQQINEAEWGNLRAAESFLDNFIKLTKEESLTPTISLTPYTSTIGAVQDFYLTKLAQFSPSNPPKLSSRHGLVLIKLAVLGLVKTSGYLREISSHRDRAITLLKLIQDAISKIDQIQVSSSGSAYIVAECELGKKLELKFQFAQILWRESTNDDDSDGAASYDWGAWLEAIERDIWSLSKSSEFRSIPVERAQDSCTLFLQANLSTGPWNVIAQKVREELEKGASKNEKIKELTEKINEIRLAWSKCQQELKDTLILKLQLQRKAAELNQRATRIPALQDQNARLNETLNQYQNSLTECRAVIERLTLENKELTNVQAVVLQAPVLRPQNRRLETMVQQQPAVERKGFSFLPRTVIGDRGIIKEYRQLVKGMTMEHCNAQYNRSLALLRRVTHNSDSAFNRYMASKRPQNLQTKASLKNRMKNLEQAIQVSELESLQRVKETQGCVRVLRISQNPYDPLRAYRQDWTNSRKQHQEQLKQLYQAKLEIKEFSSRLHEQDPKFLQILTQEVLVSESSSYGLIQQLK